MNMLIMEPDMESTSKHDRAQHSVMHEMHEAHSAHPDNANAHAGHDPHAGHSVAMFRDKFWLNNDHGGPPHNLCDEWRTATATAAQRCRYSQIYRAIRHRR